MNTYQIFDVQTKTVIKEFVAANGHRARNYAEKKNMAHGAQRYTVKVIFA